MTAPATRPTPGPDVYVGLMSGTSTDGISAAAARFADAGDGTVRVTLLGFAQRAYDAAQRARLLDAMQQGSARDYCRLSADLGDWLADAAAALLAESGVARADVRAVASHGQTLWHEPGHSTWQAGESAVIAERLGVDVISDFRVRDVAAGGQGAPLVPIADTLLFAAPDRWRALQNLGGIGNVTVVPPAAPGRDPSAGVRAFDTGPGVAVIDLVARRVRPSLPFDVDGRLAAAGTPVDAAVDALLADDYFAAPPPKSTGRELFGAAYAERLVEAARAGRAGATDEDLVATAVALTARSVADAYARFLPEPVREVLLSGGGARNPVLAAAIAREVARRDGAPRVRAFDEVFFDGEAKEAVAFALLGWLHVERRPGNVPGATGARGPRVLGKLTPA
ncbi:anhydro-N-acetylmuramic acid kinase [Roseisolibacter sp. H3M3-2]|uniref:anhydro-N-acetylmuramic acid kinase n=1 Tax=Roseisolibacter sp. H3M3-2 TaxID=3031323 RepID=UPI0023DC0A29|nr:anhydro-N-acetylmuramic acid kinase [Roseisolibacter sp. H3M3-2]MDF1505612.1 anhydro-N-acetylmuramic acid kinase [Roseisolibacter sp. H3M3-2]